MERNSNHWWTRNSKQSYCILKLVIMEVLFYTNAGTRYFIFSLASTGYFILKCLVLGTFLWRQNNVTQRLSLWWRSCPAWWWSAGMHPGHLAPTYHQSMTDLALIEVRIVAQSYPEPADGDHGKHEQDDVQPAIWWLHKLACLWSSEKSWWCRTALSWSTYAMSSQSSLAARARLC